MEIVSYEVKKIVLEEKNDGKDGKSGWIRLSVTEKGQEHIFDFFGIEDGKPLEIQQGGNQ